MVVRYAFGTLAIMAAAGCATIPGVRSGLRADFDAVPEVELRQAALEIEQAVLEADREYTPRDHEGLVLDTELVRQAVRTRTLRGERINELRETPWAYEQRSGTLALLRGWDYRQQTTRMQRRDHAALVYRENDSRWTLYEAIQKANNLDSSGYDAVRVIFFQARLEVMPPGQQYEGPDGALQATGES